MTKDNPGPNNPSGFAQIWRFWRHCCCIYGWYPVIVAPIVTAAALLDIYSTIGCEFINLEVGFTPSNPAWNQSTVDLGLFSLSLDNVVEKNEGLKDVFTKGCHDYPSAFEEFFIDGDKTWTASRIMAIISASAGFLALLTSWLMVTTPLPARFFWPAVLLPSIMVGFLAQGSKFLFFDTKICQGYVWFPFGENAIPRTANSCTLGSTGIYAIAAGAVYFVALLFVCLKTPEKRHLLEFYGKMESEEQGDLVLEPEVVSSVDGSSDEEAPYFAPVVPLPFDLVKSDSSKEEIYEASDGLASQRSDDFFAKSTDSNLSMPNLEKQLTKECVDDYDCVPGPRDEEEEDGENKENAPDTRDDVVSGALRKPSELRLGSETDGRPTKKLSEAKDQDEDDDDDDEERGYLPYKTESKAPMVSESRLSKKEKMEAGTANEELIDRFVLEFDKSFATDDESMAGRESIASMASF